MYSSISSSKSSSKGLAEKMFSFVNLLLLNDPTCLRQSVETFSYLLREVAKLRYKEERRNFSFSKEVNKSRVKIEDA